MGTPRASYIQDACKIEIDVETETATDPALQRLEQKIEELSQAASFTKQQHATKLLGAIEGLLDREEGMEMLYSYVPRMVQAGVFEDTVWKDPASLFAPLVGGTLRGSAGVAAMEVISELRVLAFAEGIMKSADFSAQDAKKFLQQLLVQNLDLTFPSGTEADRETDERVLQRGLRLFKFLLQRLPLAQVRNELAREVRAICSQRPIATERVREMLEMIHDSLELEGDDEAVSSLRFYVNALFGPTEGARQHQDLAEYKEWLSGLDEEGRKQECQQLGRTMKDTGLVSIWHPVALHFVLEHHSKLVPTVLELDRTGRVELEKNQELVEELIREAVSPATPQSVYGLALLLERGLLTRDPVVSGLQQLIDLEIAPAQRENILRTHEGKGTSANRVLLADTISVLGQPLGIGQGWNPTCQAARGISLWSQHAPGKLLNLIYDAAKYNKLEFRFEGQIINSKLLQAGLAKKLDYKLDSVSVVLVPHLDRVYNEMMRRASFRAEDPHKWANPALYGHWIPTGFACAYNQGLNAIVQYENFVRLFYATHHPEYTGGHALVYPNPVGIFITGPQGKFLGFHAISLLRVAEDPQGEVRIYFLNPNNEGRQQWDEDMHPSVMDHGERPGESSLPFHQMVSRIYAFHYNEAEVGNVAEVRQEQVQSVVKLAKDSWGANYQWL